MMAFAQRMANVPVSKVELTIECSDLMDKDITSKSDPCCVLYLLDEHKRLIEHGRTEVVKNTLNPKFTRSFQLDYYFEEVQKLRFAVYDLDNETASLADDDCLGFLECSLGQLVSCSPFKHHLMTLKNKPVDKGSITVRAEEVAKLQDVLTLSFKAKKLDKKDFLGKSDPYLEFSRQASDGTWIVVARTEVVKNDLSPTWRPLVVKAQKLCAGNYEAPIRVACFDYDNDGSHDLIGIFMTTAAKFLTAAQAEVSWPVINPKKESKKSYTDSGTVTLKSCTVSKEYSFLDYVFAGLQINCTIAIDFTASNGNPMDPRSLHYIDPYAPNEYMRAITSVGAVIQDYDSDQLFPALGFGAQIPPHNQTSHEFAINFNASNPFCAGIQGVLDAYTACLRQVTLYGPTNFAPIIHHVSQFAAAARQTNVAKNYFVLLILTDGAITDVAETVAAIVNASYLPMSIIIVGVGQANFDTMNCLDADDKLLRDHSGRKAQRDIVQFVPFREFKQMPPATLAKHVLAEVPRQVTDYYRVNGIAPFAPPQ